MLRQIIAFVWSVITLDIAPRRWRLPLFALAGVAAGLGLLTLRVSEFASYLSDGSRTCINCHIMVPEYLTWERSAHRAVAVCNDCHVPHDSALRKYAFKAKDGSRHAAIFAMRREPQVIRALPASQDVVQENCARCHSRRLSGAFLLAASGRRCTDCHGATPHGEVHSLSSTPTTPFPHLPPLLGGPPGDKP